MLVKFVVGQYVKLSELTANILIPAPLIVYVYAYVWPWFGYPSSYASGLILNRVMLSYWVC